MAAAEEEEDTEEGGNALGSDRSQLVLSADKVSVLDAVLGGAAPSVLPSYELVSASSPPAAKEDTGPASSLATNFEEPGRGKPRPTAGGVADAATGA